LNKSTATKLLSGTALQLEKIYDCLKDVVLSDGYKAGDETYHKVLVNKVKPDDAGSKNGYIWSLLAMNLKLMYYFYDDGSRSEDVLLDKLEGKTLTGALQSDGLNVYKKVAEKYGLIKLSCLQHCRRPLYDLKGNPDADAVIQYVGNLYHNDHKHRIGTDNWTAKDNFRWRREYAPPILKELKKKLEDIASDEEKYPPKSEIHKAAAYVLNEWQGLENIFTNGGYRLDNNQKSCSDTSRCQEETLSSSAATRGQSAEPSSYSLACSCKLQKKNFFRYLSDVLNKAFLIPNGSPTSAYRHLLPDVWKESTEEVNQ